MSEEDIMFKRFEEFISMSQEESINLRNDDPDYIEYFVQVAKKVEYWHQIAFLLHKHPTWRDLIFYNIGDDDLELLKDGVRDLKPDYDEISPIAVKWPGRSELYEMIEGEKNKRAAELDYILNFNEPSETIDRDEYIKLMQKADQEMLEVLDEHPEIGVSRDTTIQEGMSKEEFEKINSEMENSSPSFVDIDTYIEEGLSTDEILSKLEYESGIHLSNE